MMQKLIRSFWVAFQGIGLVLRTERNFQIHSVCLGLVLGLGVFFSISQSEWIFILLISAVVLSLEMINTALEKTMNFIHPEKHDAVKKIKDIAAGSVLIAAIFAVAIALIIFLPKLGIE